MRARIAQLETKLDNARVAPNIARLEQNVTQQMYQAEQNLCLKVTTQRNSVGSTLSQGGKERSRARPERALSRKSPLSGENEDLRKQLATAKEELKLERLRSEESSQHAKVLGLNIEQAQALIQKLELQKRNLESNLTVPENTEVKLKKLDSGLRALESDLISTQEQLQSTQVLLDSTQISLDLMEEKHASTRLKYAAAKEKLKRRKERLRSYKGKLRDEQNIVQSLKDMLTPEIYKSLGETHRTIGTFLFSVGTIP